MKKTFLLLAIAWFAVNLSGQQIKVSGTITEKSSGLPLIGVNVHILGTVEGTISGDDRRLV